MSEELAKETHSNPYSQQRTKTKLTKVQIVVTNNVAGYIPKQQQSFRMPWGRSSLPTPHSPQCHLLQLPSNGIPVREVSSADVEFPSQHSLPEGSPKTETYGLECWMLFSKYADYFICYSSSVPSNILPCLPSQSLENCQQVTHISNLHCLYKKMIKWAKICGSHGCEYSEDMNGVNGGEIGEAWRKREKGQKWTQSCGQKALREENTLGPNVYWMTILRWVIKKEGGNLCTSFIGAQ